MTFLRNHKPSVSSQSSRSIRHGHKRLGSLSRLSRDTSQDSVKKPSLRSSQETTLRQDKSITTNLSNQHQRPITRFAGLKVPVTRAAALPIACRTRKSLVIHGKTGNHSYVNGSANSPSSSTPTSTAAASTSTSQPKSTARKKTSSKRTSTTTVVSEETYEVEQVLGNKFENGQYLFLIKWKGYSDAFNSWEPERHLEPDLLESLMEDIKKEKVFSSKPYKRPNICQGYSPRRSLQPPISSSNTHHHLRSLPKTNTLSLPSSKGISSINEMDVSTSKLSSKSSSCSSSGVSSLPSPSSPSSSRTSCQSPNNLAINSPHDISRDRLKENDRVLSTLIPGKVVSIENNVQGRKAALVKFLNQDPLAWIDYDYAKCRMPDLVLDYYENILVFA